VLRDRGVVHAARFNAMLVAAAVLNRINRRHYPQLTEAEARRRRTSDTVFVFGSGYSLNDLDAADWEHIGRHDVFGFNAFYYQRWVPVHFHLLRGGLYGELRWRRYAGEVAETIAHSRFYRDTVFVMPEEFLSDFANQLVGYRLLPPVSGLLRYRTARNGTSAPTASLGEGLRHIAGTLSDAVNCAFCLGWTTIVLAGVDLYDSRYFWLPPDQTASVDLAGATVTGATVNALRGTRSHDRHHTTTNGVVELMAEWRRYFADRGVRLSVYNPRSLLADVLPVYERPAAWIHAPTSR
jgi:hypothetical protein